MPCKGCKGDNCSFLHDISELQNEYTTYNSSSNHNSNCFNKHSKQNNFEIQECEQFKAKLICDKDDCAFFHNHSLKFDVRLIITYLIIRMKISSSYATFIIRW